MFLKAISSLTGPFNPIFRGPNQGVKFDWEVELVVLAALTLRQRLWSLANARTAPVPSARR
jgi:2-keto-4-pentenoate hydratase/2-oxohepta-3-ene-1,7-dioic acid hydratase in catechol pathway